MIVQGTRFLLFFFPFCDYRSTRKITRRGNTEENEFLSRTKSDLNSDLYADFIFSRVKRIVLNRV